MSAANSSILMKFGDETRILIRSVVTWAVLQYIHISAVGIAY